MADFTGLKIPGDSKYIASFYDAINFTRFKRAFIGISRYYSVAWTCVAIVRAVPPKA